MLKFFGARAGRRQTETLYRAVSEASRQPGLYLECGIPDTVEGRFESLGLHVSLILRRLKHLPPPALETSKQFVDLFFQDLDGSLRELGVGDLSVGKRIKRLAEAFYGRAKALDSALADSDEATLRGTLARNVLGIADASGDDGGALAAYVRRSVAALAALDLAAMNFAAINAGGVLFSDLRVEA